MTKQDALNQALASYDNLEEWIQRGQWAQAAELATIGIYRLMISLLQADIDSAAAQP